MFIAWASFRNAHIVIKFECHVEVCGRSSVTRKPKISCVGTTLINVEDLKFSKKKIKKKKKKKKKNTAAAFENLMKTQ